MSDTIIAVIISSVVAVLSIVSNIVMAIRFSISKEYEIQKNIDKKWEIITQLYAKIIDFDNIAEEYMNPLNRNEDLGDNVTEAFKELYLYWQKNIIFLPKEIMKEVEIYMLESRDNIQKHFTAKEMSRLGHNMTKAQNKTWKKHREGAIKKIRETMNEQFIKNFNIKNKS